MANVVGDDGGDGKFRNPEKPTILVEDYLINIILYTIKTQKNK